MQANGKKTARAATYYKNENGVYCWRFTPPKNKWGSKKRIYVQCPPQNNTTEFLKTLARDAVTRHLEGKFTTSDTFGAYVKETYIEQYVAARNLSHGSKKQLRYLLEKLAAPHLGPVPLGAIDAAAVAKAVAKMKTELRNGRPRYSDRTIALMVCSIITMLKWAARLGDIPAKPEIPIPKVMRYHKPKPYNTRQVQETIAAAKNNTQRVVLSLLYETGMREAEVLGLQWSQIDFDRKVISVDRQLVRGERKDGAKFPAPRVLRMTTKGNSERLMPMSPQLIKALRGIQHMRSSYVICHDGSIPRYSAGKPYSVSWLRAVLESTRKVTELPHTRIHDSRHHFATRCSAAGMNPFALQRLLGHKDIRTTMGYVHPEVEAPPSVLEGTG
jgi:integrase